MTQVEQRWKALCERRRTRGDADLSPDESAWVNVRALIDSIENGGLISYFYNSGADDLNDARAALSRLGAGEVLTELDRVAALFGDHVPATAEARSEAIAAWPEDGPHEDLLEEVDDTLMPLLADLEARLLTFLAATGQVDP